MPAQLDEQTILRIVYSLTEGDADGWETTSDEYLAARIYANAAIVKWEFYDNTVWRELWTTLTDASDGTKTLTAGTYAYDCPTDMRRPGSFIRTGGTTFWDLIKVENLAKYADTNGKFCWFTGSVKAGFKLNFNPNEVLATGNLIEYEYYKQATTFTAITSTSEVPDPYFIVYYVLARIVKNDGEDNTEELQEADDRLETMRVANMSGYFDVENTIEETRGEGFGK